VTTSGSGEKMIYSVRSRKNEHYEWASVFQLLFSEIHLFNFIGTSLKDILLVSKAFRWVITSNVRTLTFLDGIPLHVLQSIYTRHKMTHSSLSVLTFSRCSVLTDALLQDILSSFSVDITFIRECHSLSMRPPGAEILYKLPLQISQPVIYVPGCWKLFSPDPSLSPRSVLEVQLCALEYFEVDYDAAIKFNSFVADHRVTNIWSFFENNGLLPVDLFAVMIDEEINVEDDEVTVTAYINFRRVSFDFKLNVHTKCWEMIDPFFG
jgi:hypothetical protein